MGFLSFSFFVGVLLDLSCYVGYINCKNIFSYARGLKVVVVLVFCCHTENYHKYSHQYTAQMVCRLEVIRVWLHALLLSRFGHVRLCATP